jgi:sterol 3beta-glucosyltransferase
MRVDILAIGSRGDVQLYVALGLGLRAAGYRVRMVTLGGFEELLRDRGLDHLVIGDTPQQIANTSEGRDWVKKRTSSPAGFFRGFVQVANALIEEGIARYWNSCADIEAVIVSPIALLLGEHIAERLGVPLIRTQAPPPVMPTSYAWDGSKSWGSAVQGHLEPLIHKAFHFVVWSKLRHSTNAARSKILGLPTLSLTEPFRRSDKTMLLLGAYSPAVAPPRPDWPSWIHVTGYWFLDEPGWAPPRELADFLDSGSRPVFVGFGSTPFPNPEASAELVVRALKRVGHRGILVAGESGLPTGRLSPDVLSVASVPHGWLFARVCAAVHHGGAGVTGSALRAGLPSVVVPIFADQPFWGKRVFQLGVGPPPIPVKSLTEEKLVNAIRATASQQMRQRAAEIGEKISREDGIGRAVEIIDRHLGRSAAKVMSQHAN